MHYRSVLLAASLSGLLALVAPASAEAPAAAATCTACHGADGNSVNPIWPKLAGQGAPYILAQIKAFQSGARENASMAPMVASLAEDDAQAIAAYYAAQSTRIESAGDADVSAAEKLYRGGDAERGIPACMACHGPTGAGNGPARYPSLSGQHAQYTALQLKAYRDGSRATDPQGMMRAIAARLSDADIDRLAAYLAALH